MEEVLMREDEDEHLLCSSEEETSTSRRKRCVIEAHALYISKSADDVNSSSDSHLCSSSTDSSQSWEILEANESSTTRDGGRRGSNDVVDDESENLMTSVSREAKLMVSDLRCEMKEISDGYSKIASGVDRVTTGIASRLNKAFSEGAKQAGGMVSSLKKDLFDKKDNDGNTVGGSSTSLMSGRPSSDTLTLTTDSQSHDLATSLPPASLNPQGNPVLDNQNKTILRKITSVINNSSTLLPINLRALHTHGLFSPTNQYSSHPVATEISYCGPGEQMIIETQQNDPFDPIAVLVVYELVDTTTKESVGYLRLQAVWHCFEPVPQVGVSLGSEPTPASEANSLTSLELGNSVRVRCIAKQLDAMDDDYYVQSISLVSEEVGTIVGRTFDKLVKKWKEF